MLRRILYVVALLAAIGFYIFHTGYFSWLLLIIAVALVPFELLLSLYCITTVRLEFTVRELSAEEGGGYLLTAAAPARFPVGTVKARLVRSNLFTGAKRRLKLRLPAGERCGKAVREYHLPPDEAPCGVVSFSLQKARVLDVMGLFSFPIKHTGAPVLILTRPPVPAEPPALPAEALDQGSLPAQTSQRPGPGAMREFTDIREYRAGDSIRDIHWKLSAKLDIIMVREGSYSSLASPYLVFDFFGEAQEVCGVLGQVEALSQELWEMERLHGVHWLGADGQLNSVVLSSRAEYDALLWKLMSTPLPKTGEPVTEHLPEVPGPVIHVQPGALALYQQGVLRGVAE